MKDAPELVLEIITDGKRQVYSFVGEQRQSRALASLHAAAKEGNVISIELHVVLVRRPEEQATVKA